MTKKELIKRIEEYKPKYIYQRYAGKINKYEILFDNELLNLETGIHIDLDRYAMLGEVSENLIDIIEVGDYVNGEKVTEIKEWNSSKDGYFRYAVTCHYEIIRADEIKTIVTKEQFESISFKV